MQLPRETSVNIRVPSAPRIRERAGPGRRPERTSTGPRPSDQSATSFNPAGSDSPNARPVSALSSVTTSRTI